MNGTILSIRNEQYNADSIRESFNLFMRAVNPTLKEKTLRTYCSDAIFIWEQLPSAWVNQLVTDRDKSDKEHQEWLRNLIRSDITATRTNPDKDAKAYTRHFWHLIEFLRIFYLIEDGRLRTPRRIGE